MDISKEKNVNVLMKALSRVLNKYDRLEDGLEIIVFCNDNVGDVDDETQIDKILDDLREIDKDVGDGKLLKYYMFVV